MFDEDEVQTRVSASGRVGLMSAVNTEAELPAAIAEVRTLGKKLAEMRNDLDAMVKRLLIGDVPPGAEGGENAVDRRAFNAGLSGELRRSIDLASETADDVMRLVRRLNGLG